MMFKNKQTNEQNDPGLKTNSMYSGITSFKLDTSFNDKKAMHFQVINCTSQAILFSQTKLSVLAR